MLYGTNRRYSRDRVPLQIIRGNQPTEPVKLSSLAPPIDGEAIRSGMVIVKDTGLVNAVSTAGAFRKAVDADAIVEALSVFIATHDQDSHDVQAAGGIVGLDCSDDYEVQTGYFDKSGGAYVLNEPLTVKVGGLVTHATEGDYIIGYVTKIGTGSDASLPYVGKTLPTATAVNAEVLQFKTARNGQIKAA